MFRRAFCVLSLGSLLWANPLTAAPMWSAFLAPPSGAIKILPGTTGGWGYEIRNEDPLLHLMLVGLSASAFANGTGTDIFDFPILAPGQTASVPFTGLTGLYSFAWDNGTPLNTVNTGTFTLSAQWFDADPFAGGVYVEDAKSQTLAFSVTAADPGSVVPEPGELVPLVGLLAVFYVIRTRQLKNPS